MPTQAGDLLTVQEVQDAALSSSSAATDNPSGVVEEAIRDVQGAITDYLGMAPIVHDRTERIEHHEWREDDTATNSDKNWIAWARHQPIVEVESPSDVSIYFDSRRFEHDKPDDLRVRYFAGYKRSDQISGEQQSRLTDLGTTPPNLPNDIRRVAIKLTLFELTEMEHGAGIGQVQQAVGQGQQTTVEGTDAQFVRRQLRRLSGHKVSEV